MARCILGTLGSIVHLSDVLNIKGILFVMSMQEWLLIAITGAALILILSNRFAPDLVALLVLLAVGLAGLVTPEQALSGFSSPVVITLVGLFMLTESLETTGVVKRIASRLNRMGAGSMRRLIVLLMLTGMALSLVMNNVAVGAMLLPAAVRVAQVSKTPLSKLLMPLSFSVMLGGMATYFTTGNIVVSGLLEAQGTRGLNMADYALTGGFVAVAGFLYMLVIGQRVLPLRVSIAEQLASAELSATYQLDERIWRVRVLPDSVLANVPLNRSSIGEKLGLTVLAITHGQRVTYHPTPETVLRPNDYLLLLGRQERVEALVAEWGVEHVSAGGLPAVDQESEVVEVIIPPRSSVIGQTLTEMNFRIKYGLTVVAMWHDGRSYRTDVGKIAVNEGDALLVVGDAVQVQRIAASRDFLVPSVALNGAARPDKMRLVLAIFAAVLALSVFEVFPLPVVMLGGAVAVVLAGALTMNEAYDAVEWRVIFLIAGMLPLSIALIETGMAQRIGEAVVTLSSGGGPLVLIVAMFMVSMLITQVIGSQVTALIFGPVALSAAAQTGIDPRAMAMVVAIACSSAFLTPVSHPVNMLMMGPGGYTFGDFFKVGIGLTLVTLAATVLAMVLFWGIG